jgi:hypothetical protein
LLLFQIRVPKISRANVQFQKHRFSRVDRSASLWDEPARRHRALVALNHGEAAKALEAVKIAKPYETGWVSSVNVGSFGALYPMRGRAYLQASQGAKAAAESQSILDQAGIPYFDPVIGVVARFHPGQAYLMAGTSCPQISASRVGQVVTRHQLTPGRCRVPVHDAQQ